MFELSAKSNRLHSPGHLEWDPEENVLRHLAPQPDMNKPFQCVFSARAFLELSVRSTWLLVPLLTSIKEPCPFGIVARAM